MRSIPTGVRAAAVSDGNTVGSIWLGAGVGEGVALGEGVGVAVGEGVGVGAGAGVSVGAGVALGAGTGVYAAAGEGERASARAIGVGSGDCRPQPAAIRKIKSPTAILYNY